MVTIEIFTRKDCPFCPDAKEVCESVVKKFKGVIIKEVDIDSKDGKKKAEFLEITTVPTVLINNEIEFTGVPREELLRSAIKEELEKEKGE